MIIVEMQAIKAEINEKIIDSGKSVEGFEVVLSSKDLEKSLNLLHSVIERKTVSPILANIKLEVGEDNVMVLTTTDMDFSISERLGVQTIQRGSLTVNCRTLHEISKKITTETISLKLVKEVDNEDEEIAYENEYLLIKGKNCEFKLAYLPSDNFPVLNLFNAETSFTVSPDILAGLIKKTFASISTEETRYNLSGIYLHSFKEENGNNFLASASTDGHRMSFAYSSIDNSLNFGVIIPKKSALKILDILNDIQSKSHEVTISLDNNKIMLACNQIILITKLIDGNFPDYRAFIPALNNNCFTIDKEVLKSSIERVEIITIEKFRSITADLSTSRIIISAQDDTKGYAEESFEIAENSIENVKQAPVINYQGEDLRIGFNPRYFKDIIEVLTGKEMIIYIKDAYSPLLIKDSGEENSIFVVMPVKV